MKIAVFGAGTMGSGIAQVFAAKGHTARGKVQPGSHVGGQRLGHWRRAEHRK